mgnify:FL=1
MISAQCTDILKMLRNLTSEKPRDGKYDPNLELRPQRSVYLHSFDALTYPLMYFDVGVGTPSVTTADSQIIEINA